MISLERAQRIAEGIVGGLEQYCEQIESGGFYIEVAGSIRRKKPQVNDIDLKLLVSVGQILTKC